MQFWALIVDGFRESRDRMIFWVMLIITLLAAVAMFCVGFEPGKVSFLFGLWEVETERFTGLSGLRADLIASIVVDLILDLVFGWVGVTLAIVATAGFFPAFMERGAIDVVLSKPIARWRLFLGKYLGGMVFVLFHATIFVVLTFLVVGCRWHVWLPGYLLTIPLMVVLFSYLYCISVLVAVYYRSTVAAVVITIFAWMAFFGVQVTGDAFEEYPSWKENRTAYRAVRLARWFVPKTQDITYLAKNWTGAAIATDLLPEPSYADRDLVDRAEAIEAERMAMSPVLTIGSSLLFEAAIVLLAMWKFSRRDY